MDPEADIGNAIRANYEGQRRAMVAGDADALGDLLADDFTLVHMTGYEQPKAEWLADVRSGAMSYSSMEDVKVSIDLSGTAPVVTARTRTTATIWGASGTWSLQLRISFSREDSSWVASGTVASTWR